MKVEILEKRREKYPPGTKIMLFKMDDPSAPPAKSIGEVVSVDDAGTIHMLWDNGSTLGLIPEVDSFEVLKKEGGAV